ncbi:uncharacterized protein LOC122504184 [Leptopilina heterotoma]|nr:uncharacterized protein LOC122504184 [Leptopilina heterotoma]
MPTDSSEDLANLKSERRVLKSKFTKFINFIKNEQNASKYTEVRLRIQKIEGILEQFEDIQSKIDAISQDSNSDDFDSFETLYYSEMSKAHDLLNKENARPVINDSLTNSRNLNQVPQNHIRLPTIELTTFDGSYDKWLDFFNSFTSMVHNNRDLSDLQKLHYLRSCLKGEAMSIISSLECSIENYSISWELLQKRFDNKRIIIRTHVDALLEYPKLIKESAQELRKLLDLVQIHLRALKSLNEPVDSWDTLIIHLITLKLDRNTHKEWEESIVGSDMPKMKKFLLFLEQRCQILQIASINLNMHSNNAGNSVPKNKPQNTQKKQALMVAGKSNLCIICNAEHRLYKCEMFLKLSIKERVEKLKEAKVCFNCLNSGHINSECKWTGCRKCGKNHNTLLHYEGRNDNSKEGSNKEINTTTNNPTPQVCSAIMTSQVLLSTAVIKMRASDNSLKQARVLLDNGSQSNFITENFAKSLNLPTKKINLPVEGLNQIETRINQSINTQIFSKHSNYKENVEFLVIPQICNLLPNQFIDRCALTIPHNIQLADPEFYKPNHIDALLGVEIFYDLLMLGQIEIPGHKAKLHKTQLGWIISGKLGSGRKCKPSTSMLTLGTLNKNICQFWELEEIKDKTFLSEEQFEVEEHFKRTTQRDPQTGNYTVSLPFNKKVENLGESFKLVEKQFLALERRLAKNPDLKSAYVKGMQESIQLGHMVEINDDDIQKRHCFLPHHPVIKESSSSTKTRIVSNASFKTSSGISLNDCLKVGAVVQNSSFEITLKFRTHQIVLVADIEKMYKQVLLNKDDAQYQLALWRENENEIIKKFIIPVVLFGTSAAPFLATRILNQLAEDERDRFPLGSKALKEDCYVDDIMTGDDDIIKTIQLRDELINITQSAGFRLRKWISNHPEVVESLAESNENIDLLINKGIETKALGIQWNTISDEFVYKLVEKPDHKYTKRTILSIIAGLYDPIGLLGPIIVSAKIVMQQLWQCNIDWDESVPHTIYTQWQKIESQLPLLNEVKFNRKVIIKDAVRIEVHGFCDASEKAYGACIYIRSENSNGNVLTNLLCSKNRVAPLKVISLPKLELCGALLLSRLIKSILPVIKRPIDEILLWSDSTITLQWITTQPNLLKTFVANRVVEITDATKTMKWRHVSSQDNAADVLSRGQLPAEFLNNALWKSGPQWLSENRSEWPNDHRQVVPLLEMKTIVSLPAALNQNAMLYKYSNINKFTRIIAFILRFLNNASKNKVPSRGSLTITELKNALIVILKMTQRECFSEEIKQLKKEKCVHVKSDLRSLNPFLDNDGLLRVGGRLKNSSLTYSEKYPIILPKGHHVTTLIIREQHLMNLHGGTQLTLNSVRAKYWPINGKNVTKSVIRKCVTCFRANPMDQNYFMGDLPRDRVVQSRPFLNVGLDYCGPFFIKEKKFRNRGKVKTYACIFVCLATKAIHIELITDLTTEAFLGGLRRFFSRRGYSSNIYSDNATNFVGAKNELHDLNKFINETEHTEEFTNFLTNKKIQWHFSPPRSPHFGGLWEAAVKSFKSHFKKTVGDALFTYEELLTYTTEIEAILNSRPITPLSDDPNDLQALTPAHFLIGDIFTNLPDLNLRDTPTNRLSSWQHIQYVRQHFWRRWSKEYLNQLTVRSKWQFKKPDNITIGTMVLLKEDNVPPLRWPLGRITEIFPGEDGLIRVITVKTHAGTYKRSTRGVARLPIE